MVFATRVCFFSFFLLVQAATCLETPYNAIEDKVKSILGDAGENGIVGGDDADPGSFTHQVALFSNSGLFICGGSLVSADIVVTAVHCTDFVAVAKIGLYNQYDDSKAEAIKICDHVAPPSGASSPRDIALLRLCQPSQLVNKGTAKTIKLNDDPNIPKESQEIILTGWGASSEYSFLASNLQNLHLKYISQTECSKSYKVSDAMMCGALMDEGKDPCLVADSGGPVVIQSNSASDDILVGVVGWGIDCARQSFPSVYSRVSGRAAWIVEEGCKLTKESQCGIETTSSSNKRRLR